MVFKIIDRELNRDTTIGFNVGRDKQICPAALAPIAVKILLCRCSAQKIATDSGKKLLKNKTIYNSLSTKYKQSISTTPDKQRNTAQPAPHPFKKNNSNNLIQKTKQKIPYNKKLPQAPP